MSADAVAKVNPASVFADSDVVEHYRCRPPYPRAVYEHLLELAPRHEAILDLGCGPGKLVRELAGEFATAVAVDASAAMLDEARGLPGGNLVSWLLGGAEEVDYPPVKFDLVTAGASLHWMDAGRVAGNLRDRLSDDHVFAVVEGDDAFEPAWASEWIDFLARWIRILKDEELDFERHDRWLESLQPWLAVASDRYFVEPVVQSVADFVSAQHSRQTFAPSLMGNRLPAFDAELTELLSPYSVEGYLEYQVRTRVTAGTMQTQS